MEVKTSDIPDSIYYYPCPLLFNNLMKIDNDESLNSAEKSALINIQNLMEYINMVKDDDWTDVIKKKLNEVFVLSNNKFIANYLVKHDILKTILKEVGGNLNLADIVLCIIINVCNTDSKIIHLIGKDSEFVNSILYYGTYRINKVLSNVIKIINLAIQVLQDNPQSEWLTHLQHSSTIIEDCIIMILKSHNQFNETLVITIIDLLWKMIKTTVSGWPSLLDFLFSTHILIYPLINFCQQVTKLKTDKPIDVYFIDKWLSIMIHAKTSLESLFELNDEKHKYTFLYALNCLLHLYKEQESFSLSQLRIHSVNYAVILKYIFLLAYIRNKFYIPVKMDHTLMQIMLKIKTVLDAEKMTNKEEQSFTKLKDFYIYLEDIWLTITQLDSSADIKRLIEPFNIKDQQYFLNLPQCEYQNFYKKFKTESETPRKLMNRVTDIAGKFYVKL
ncbi:uncharacterized protein [Cardiocondyla obscurior]